MTPRLEAARAAMAHAIAIYVPTHIYAEACAKLTNAAAELESAARVEDDKPSDPPVTLVDPLAAAVARAGIDVVSPQTLPAAPLVEPGHEVGSASAEGSEQPVPPTAAEAVADALAPYEAPPVPAVDVEPAPKQPKSRNKTK